MPKSKELSFVVQFPLDTQIFQDRILNKRFEIARNIYNALVSVTQKRYNEMTKTIAYRSAIEHLGAIDKNDKEKRKPYTDILDKLCMEYRINEYAFHADVQAMQRHFKDNIDSFTAQKIASRLWASYRKLIFGDGKTIHYKKLGELNSVEGKSNGTGIRFVDGCLLWLGLKIPVKINNKNEYETSALTNKIAYCRIVRRYVRNKNKFYLQIVFHGMAPCKTDKTTGGPKHPLGRGDVGLDIGTQTVAVSSAAEVKIHELADKTQNTEDKRRRVLRKMDRSRRAANPDNYNADGTVKKQGSKKVRWVRSKRYARLQNKLREIYRKQADIRKQQHEAMVNRIVTLGDQIYIEDMNFKGLQRRSKKSEKNDRGRFKRKKRFGKSISNKAPAMFVSILERKLKSRGTRLNKVNTRSVKASQYNHADDTYKKKKLSQRWNDIDGRRVQRDLYSAFLIMNVDAGLAGIDKDKCDRRYDNFLRLHDLEVDRLSGNKNLSSIAI